MHYCKKIAVTVKKLKDIMELLDKHSKIEIRELGDTLHPSKGFIDQSFFKSVRTVNDLIQFPYDFHGLIEFSASVGSLEISFHSEGRQSESFTFFMTDSANGVDGIISKIKSDQSSKYEFQII